MGNTSSVNGSSALSTSSLLKRYQVISKDEDKQLTIVRSKQSSDAFLIKELAFIDKNFYDRHLCRFNHFQERQQCQNVLNLVKVWTEEHTTLCSNTYKIFPMYEYSNVTLKDQIEARKTQNKHFEEDELFGIVQSFINANSSQPPILVSLSQYFISQDGLLKVNNHDLFDPEQLTTFSTGVYYSFEKMENFNETNWYENDQVYMNQAIFSLGMTLISCINLEDVGEKVYFPLHHSKRMRLNEDMLESLLNQTKSANKKISSQRFCELIEKMVHRDPSQRPSLDEIQEELDQIVRLKQSRIEIMQSLQEEFDPEEEMAKIQIEVRKNKGNKNSVFCGENLSTIQDHNKGLNTLKSKDLSNASDLDVLNEFYTGSRAKVNRVDREYQVPLVLSKTINNQKIQPVSVTYEQAFPIVEERIPCPISRQNPLFTNPQFLAKINEDIKRFSFTRKNSYASTQISRQNSNLIFVAENHSLPRH